MHLTLAHFAIGTADGDIFERAAKSAGSVAFEMSQNNHGIIVDDMRPHGNLRQMKAVSHGKHDTAILVHDVYIAECPAIDAKSFPVFLRRSAVAGIHGVRLNDRAVRDMRLKRFHHVTGQNVWPMLLTGMELDGNFAVNALADTIIEFDEMVCIDMLGEINLGF